MKLIIVGARETQAGHLFVWWMAGGLWSGLSAGGMDVLMTTNLGYTQTLQGTLNG